MKATLISLGVRLKQDYENEIYRNYIANGVQLITENTAKGVKGRYIKQTYDEIIHQKKQLSGDEIAVDIVSRLGLKNGLT